MQRLTHLALGTHADRVVRRLVKPITVTITPSRDAEGRRRYGRRGQLFDATILAGAPRTSTHHRVGTAPANAQVLVARDGRAIVQGS